MAQTALAKAQDQQQELLWKYEVKMEGAFNEVCRALRVIHDEKLYKGDGYQSFPEYCEKRWGYSKSHAHRLIDHCKIIDYLKAEGVEVLPSNEGQTRVLTKLRRNKDGTQRPEEEFLQLASNAWEMTVHAAQKTFDVPKITGSDVESTMAHFGVQGRKKKSDPAIDELKALFNKLRSTELYKVGDADKFIKKHGLDGFPADFTDMVDLLNDCAALVIR